MKTTNDYITVDDLTIPFYSGKPTRLQMLFYRFWTYQNRIRSYHCHLKFRKKVQCNICGWEGRKFWDFYCGFGRIFKNAECPCCRSQPRHRSYNLYIKKVLEKQSRPLKVLHFAPEFAIEKLFRSYSDIDYLSVDLAPGAAMRVEDITDLQFPDRSFDFIFCSHVLEHIDDDRKAMTELYRVLSNGGFAILDVPIDYKLATTYEDPSITSPKERAKAYWQFDHVRLYGLDYKDRLEAAGFTVMQDNYISSLAPETIARHSLDDTAIHYCEK